MVNSRILQNYSLFGGLLEEQIESIMYLMHQQDYDPETAIITEGKHNDQVYFIIDGKVAVMKGGVVLTRLGEGEAFGEMEILDVMPAVATIKTMTPVKVMSISNKDLREIYKKDIKIFSLIIMNLARGLSRRLRKMDEKLVSSSST